MKSRPAMAVCSDRRIEEFLNGQLDADAHAAFERHLDHCHRCCATAERLAADDDHWQEAQQYLQLDGPDIDDDPLVVDVAGGPRDLLPSLIQHVVDSLVPSEDPQMLGRLGPYDVAGVVGSGGMGVVLKAVDRSLDRRVAIKVLAPHLATNGAARRRFNREARAAAAVLHPNVIAIHSVSNNNPLPYLVMPFVRGMSLQKRLDAEGPLSVEEVLRIGAQIAAGLAAAHAQGLVHRDIKPANILLEDGVERVTITDFGLARAVDDASITMSGIIAGTPQYMSPEQARGEAIDQRSDLFSLGSVLYAMCTGRPAFRAESSYGVLRRITDDEPHPIRDLNPAIPNWLCDIISRLMNKNREARFSSAAELAELLERCLAHVQQPTAVALPESLAPVRLPRTHRTPAWQLAISLATGFAFMAGICGLLLWINEPRTDSSVTQNRAEPQSGPQPSEPPIDDEGKTGSEENHVPSDSDSPSWGETVQGVQAGVTIGGDQRAFQMGEQLSFTLHLRNVTDRPIRVQYHTSKTAPNQLAPLVESSGGDRVVVQAMRYRGGHHSHVLELPPGRSVDVQTEKLSLGPAPSNQTIHTWSPFIEPEYPVELVLAVPFFFRMLDADGKPADKSTQVQSGFTKFKVTESKPQNELEKADPLWTVLGFRAPACGVDAGEDKSGKRGITVTEVRAESPAATAGLLPSDTIVHLDHRVVPASAELDAVTSDILTQVRKHGERKVKLEVLRNDKPKYLVMELTNANVPDESKEIEAKNP